MSNVLIDIDRERTRLAYLEAMGVASFVSRRDLPGAAPSPRVRVVLRQPPAEPERVRASSEGQQPTLRPAQQPARPPTRKIAPEKAPAAESRAEAAIAFSVILSRLGNWLWLEEAPPLGSIDDEYQHLLRAIGLALGWEEANFETRLFNWPLRGAANVGQGITAARDNLQGFFASEMERGSPAGVVLLGEFKEPWFDQEQFKGCRMLQTVSAREMLRHPQLKRQAWADLRGLR